VNNFYAKQISPINPSNGGFSAAIALAQAFHRCRRPAFHPQTAQDVAHMVSGGAGGDMELFTNGPVA
jgi:hypothetical protein